MKKIHITNIIIFAVVLAAICPILLFAPRPNFSEVENRELASLPKFTFERFFSGEFTHDLNVYFSDTVPSRDSLSELSSLFKSKMGFSVDGVTFVPPPSANPKPQTPSVTEQPPTVETDSLPTETAPAPWNGTIDAPADEAEEAEVEFSNEGVIVCKNRAMMVIGYVTPKGENYANVMEEYNQRLENVNTYSMVIPTSIEFYCPKNYIKEFNIDQRESINNINSYLENVTPVNVYSALAAHSKDDIYLRTDHHWAPLGAFYAAEQFAKASGVPFSPLSTYEKVVIPEYVGSMYGYSGRNPVLKNNPEDFVYYKPANNYSTTYNIIYDGFDPDEPYNLPLFIEDAPISSSYSIFLGSDARIAHITTDVKNSRKLAVFKDSYGNALIPFLTGSFEEIIVIDPRFFPYNGVDYLVEKGVTDVLFANNIAMANDGYFIGLFEKMLEN